MLKLDHFMSTPFGSMLTQDANKQAQLLEATFTVPKALKNVLTQPTTGAYIRGLVKTYGLAEKQAPVVAFAILRVGLGEKTIAQLAGLLATELSMPPDKAQKVANEIEHDIFAPVQAELKAYLDRPEKRGGSINEQSSQPGTRLNVPGDNVLNLKDEQQRPGPPPMPSARKQ